MVPLALGGTRSANEVRDDALHARVVRNGVARDLRTTTESVSRATETRSWTIHKLAASDNIQVAVAATWPLRAFSLRSGRPRSRRHGCPLSKNSVPIWSASSSLAVTRCEKQWLIGESPTSACEALVPCLTLPDPNDVHVLAAAIVGPCRLHCDGEP